jgi:uncharacterized protein YhbP (UPF0306 family)
MGIVTVRGTLSQRPVRTSLIRLLRENVLASFATVDARGCAHINTAYFAWSTDWTLFFYSYPSSSHCRNLADRPSMAVAIFDSRQRWGRADRGVQLFGTGCEAFGRRAEVAAAVYAKRFPGFEKWRARLGRAEGTFQLRPYEFCTRRVKLFDERSLGAGRFVEVDNPRPRILSK